MGEEPSTGGRALPDTVLALRSLAVGGDRRLLAAAADEIERLRAQVAELLPLALADAKSGVAMAAAPPGHVCDPGCEDCEWYDESLLLLNRIQSGEFGPVPND